MTRPYDPRHILTLLIQNFTHEELHWLCYNVFHFKPVYDELTRNTGVDRPLEYTQEKILLHNRLISTQKFSLAGYEQYYLYFVTTFTPAPSDVLSTQTTHTPFPFPPSSKSEAHINNPKNLSLLPCRQDRLPISFTPEGIPPWFEKMLMRDYLRICTNYQDQN